MCIYIYIYIYISIYIYIYLGEGSEESANVLWDEADFLQVMVCEHFQKCIEDLLGGHVKTGGVILDKNN